MKTNFKKLHAKTKLEIIQEISLCWAIYCVNDNQEVNNVENVQIICYIICYNGLINASNLKTQMRKGLISFYKTKKKRKKHF